MSTKYLALLRGINVGGKNIIKMADLRQCFEAMGFGGVQTYIQSGNVVFSSAEPDLVDLTERIENRLSEAFSYSSRVLLVSEDEIEVVVNQAPDGFGSDHSKFKYDVLFMMPEMEVGEAISEISVREGIDEMHAGKRVIYFSRLTEKAGSSYLNKVVSQPLYKKMTIRNWNTTAKLHEMMQLNEQ